jgi:hypothetical protein
MQNARHPPFSVIRIGITPKDDAIFGPFKTIKRAINKAIKEASKNKPFEVWILDSGGYEVELF